MDRTIFQNFKQVRSEVKLALVRIFCVLSRMGLECSSDDLYIVVKVSNCTRDTLGLRALEL